MVDSLITLFESSNTSFTTNGLGCLSDAISCIVIEERNGIFELEMEYPITGQHYEELALRRIIVAKSTPYSSKQAFRIYAITKPMNGVITVNAEHISYDLNGYVVTPFSAESVPNALTTMKAASVIPCPFTFYTDKTTAAKMEVVKPSTIRSLLGGCSGSLLDVYGGEYEFDNFTVKLLNNRGGNRGVSIRYGKNLTDLEQEENCSSVYTGVYPFWYSEQDGLMQLPERILNCEGTYNFTKIYPLDFSDKWQEQPTETELRDSAKSFMKTNRIGIPKVSLNVSFVQLADCDEYQDFALLETVRLCDTVNVEFPEFGVSAISKCVKTTYDVITDKYTGIELGDTRSNLASTISSQGQSIEETPSRMKTVMDRAIENATLLITGGLGGYVIMRDSSGGKHPDEILIMDAPDIKTAKKVWRWNKNGLGYSSKGYNGPYELAATQDGSIVANFITTGILTANLIKAGILQSNDGKTFYLDVENGILRMMAESLQIDGKTVDQIASKEASDAVKAQTQTDIFNKLTNNGATQGIYLKDGKLYLNATYMQTGELTADLIKAGILKSSDEKGSSWINMNTGEANLTGVIQSVAKNTSDGTVKTVLDSKGVYVKKSDECLRGFYVSSDGKKIIGDLDVLYIVAHKDGDVWGEPLAIINISNAGQPSFVLKDKNGNTREKIGLYDAGTPYIKQYDERGTLRAEVGTFSDGNPNVCLYDISGTRKVEIWSEDDGGSYVNLFDKNGNIRFQGGVMQNSRPFIQMRDQNGNTAYELFENPSQHGDIRMLMYGSGGALVNIDSKSLGGTPSITLKNTDGDTFWQVYADYHGKCCVYQNS